MGKKIRFVIMDRCQPLPLPDARMGRRPKVGENKLYPPYGTIKVNDDKRTEGGEGAGREDIESR